MAAGVFDGYFELNLSEWDVAAGGLLVEEADGTISDWAGGPDYLSRDILAGSPAVYPMLVEAAAASPLRQRSILRAQGADRPPPDRQN